jgi:bacteriorhodopsin
MYKFNISTNNIYILKIRKVDTMSQETKILYWIYAGIMLIGSLIIATMSRNPKGVSKIDYFISLFIPAWSAILYIFVANGYIDSRFAFYARYLDILVTMPLLLIAICLTGMHYVKKDKFIIFSIVGVDIITILCGFVGSVSMESSSYIWLIIGFISFFIVLWLIWGPIENIARTQGCYVYGLYKKLALYLTIFWIVYIIAWVIGPFRYGLISQRVNMYIFIILSIFYKLGFVLIDVLGLRKVEENKYI